MAFNGRYLREICDNASDECDLVEAAVAYASEERLLFDWCLKFDISLKYWGRFDPTLPVSPRILKKFLDRRSPNFTCKLLTHFHSKVIWWHGVGAYIGSANLSDPAWNGNIEAGCFFSEGDLEASGTDLQLRDFFQRIDAQATPLTEELYKVIEARAKELNAIADRDHEAEKKFLAASSMKQWGGLLATAPKAASERKKAAFLTEWFDTLQTLRDIGKRISSDENRPKWLTADVPYGAQADQFLHAHYYHYVIDDQGRSRFAEHFERIKRILSVL